MHTTETHVTERCCVECHFLTESDGHGGKVSASETNRSELKKDDNAQWVRNNVKMLKSFSCFKNVWSPVKADDFIDEMRASSPSLPNSDFDRMVEVRGETCFFFRSRPRMTLEAAEELERREADRRESERDRKLTRRAFWVAFAALGFSIVMAGANLWWTMWTYYHPKESIGSPSVRYSSPSLSQPTTPIAP